MTIKEFVLCYWLDRHDWHIEKTQEYKEPPLGKLINILDGETKLKVLGGSLMIAMIDSGYANLMAWMISGGKKITEGCTRCGRLRQRYELRKPPQGTDIQELERLYSLK